MEETRRTITYNIPLEKDKSSRHYKVLKYIEKHYGTLGVFLDEINVQFENNQ